MPENFVKAEAGEKDEQKDSMPRWSIATFVAVSVASLITIIAAVVIKQVSCPVVAIFSTPKTVAFYLF